MPPVRIGLGPWCSAAPWFGSLWPFLCPYQRPFPRPSCPPARTNASAYPRFRWVSGAIRSNYSSFSIVKRGVCCTVIHASFVCLWANKVWVKGEGLSSCQQAEMKTDRCRWWCLMEDFWAPHHHHHNLFEQCIWRKNSTVKHEFVHSYFVQHKHFGGDVMQLV